MLGLVPLPLVLLSVWPSSKEHHRRRKWLWGALGEPIAGISAVAVMILARRPWSVHLCIVASGALINWVDALLTAMYPADCWSKETQDALLQTSIVLHWVIPTVSQLIILQRVHSLQQAMCKKVGYQKMKLLAVCYFFVVLLKGVLFVMDLSVGWESPGYGGPHTVVRLVADRATALISCFFGAVAVYAFGVPYMSLQHLCRTAAGTSYEHQSRKAIRAALAQLWGVAVLVIVNAAQLFVNALKHEMTREQRRDPIFDTVSVVCRMLEMVAYGLVPFLLSGILEGVRGAALCIEDPARATPRKVTDGHWGRRLTAAHLHRHIPDERWEHKVTELAHRAFTVESLLHFYAGLGVRYMSHFNAAMHTTEDVVRSAIIPLTRESQCHYSKLMTGGDRRRPDRFCTHNWSNLFHDLVAAIVADALNECEFGLVAHFLRTKVPMLLEMLHDVGSHERTYWVCAFCINQHACICDSSPESRLDPMLRSRHRACSCAMPKVLNTTPPTLSDGRSIGCEMNKFADMLLYLHATDRGFMQIVAIDASFALFTRAWCIAEIATGSKLGIRQSLKFYSRAVLDANEEKLRNIRIQDMSASRMEDIEEILSTIPDPEMFNMQLQMLIFDDEAGLLASWRGLDSAQQMMLVGRLARWHFASEGSRSVWKL